MEHPKLLRLNGYCGKPAPRRLRLLIQPGTDRCPVAQGLEDPDVLVAAHLVPGPYTDGVLTGDAAQALTVPHKWRALASMARGWRADFTKEQQP